MTKKNQKFVVKVGYQLFAFDDKESAMRFYMLITESTPVTNAYCYPHDAPESMKGISFVRNEDVEIELTSHDASKFALHMTSEEYKEKCKPQPTEIDGDARLVSDAKSALIEGPLEDADIF